MEFDLTVWKIEEGNIQKKNLLYKLLGMTLFNNNTTNIRRKFPDEVMEENLGCDRVLLSSQRFKI